MGWKEFLFGNDEEDKQQTLLTDEQNSALKNYFANPIEKSPLYGAGGDYLQRLLSNDPEAYKDFEKPYLENFEQNIAPSIAQRYAGMGTGASGLSTGGFQSSLAQAGRGLQTDLAAQRGKMQMSALPQALQYAQQPYSNTIAGTSQRTFENIHRPADYGLVGNAAEGFITGASKAAGKGVAGFFNPMSAVPVPGDAAR